MTIREEMLERRKEAKEQIKVELQREVEKVREFIKERQKENPFSTEFSFPVYESGDFVVMVEDEKETLYINLKNQIEMKPEDFRKFLEERLEEEGVELTKETMKISLL